MVIMNFYSDNEEIKLFLCSVSKHNIKLPRTSWKERGCYNALIVCLLSFDLPNKFLYSTLEILIIDLSVLFTAHS